MERGVISYILLILAVGYAVFLYNIAILGDRGCIIPCALILVKNNYKKDNAMFIRILALVVGLFLGDIAPTVAAKAEKPREGRLITLNTAIGTSFDAYQVGPSGSSKSVLLLHDRWGLDEMAMDSADRFAAQGFLALAIDLFDGRSANIKSDEQGARLMSQIDPEWPDITIRAALHYLNKTPGRKTAVLGWGYGGGRAMRATIEDRLMVISTVIYYGPLEGEADELREIRGPILGVFANDDKWVTPDKVDRFSFKMQSARSSFVVTRVPGQPGFVDPRRSSYNESEAKRSWQRVLEFLNETLQ